jgi:hypothetical protein
MDTRRRDEELADLLLAEDGKQRWVAERKGWNDSHAGLLALLENEQAAELRIRKIAVRAWAAVVALVPLLSLTMFIRRFDDGFARDAIRAALMVTGIFAMLAVFVALLTTVAWLFHPRRASLAVIERRLAALESLLTRRG